MDPRATILTVLGAGLAASCATELDLETWRGEHIDYKWSESLQICGGTHVYMDRFVPFITGELGLADPSGRIEYQWLTGEQLLEQTGGRPLDGIASASLALSRDPVLLHELVHAVVLEAQGTSIPFFSEGIAAAYQRRGPNDLRFPALRDPTTDILLEVEDGLNYGVAGTFTTFLLTRNGPGAFFDLYRSVRGATDLERVDAELRRIYGEDLKSLAEQFLSEAPCTADHFPVLAYDCAAPEQPWKDSKWTYSTSLDCADENVYGGLSEDTPTLNAASVTLQIETSGTYHLRAVGDAGATIRVGPCFGCPWERPDSLLNSEAVTTVNLDAGSYFVRVEVDSGTIADVLVDLTPAIDDPP